MIELVWDGKYKDGKHRTHKQPELEVKAAHVYETPEVCTVLVKVIDLLGHDTTNAVCLGVK